MLSCFNKNYNSNPSHSAAISQRYRLLRTMFEQGTLKSKHLKHLGVGQCHCKPRARLARTMPDQHSKTGLQTCRTSGAKDDTFKVRLRCLMARSTSFARTPGSQARTTSSCKRAYWVSDACGSTADAKQGWPHRSKDCSTTKLCSI